MSEISERLQDIIDERFNRNKAAFARAVEISPTTLASYFDSKKKSKPSSEVLQKIVENTGVDALWLLTGKGDAFPTRWEKSEHHTNSDNNVIGDEDKVNSDNNGSAIGQDNVVMNMPCPDDAQHIRDLEKEVEKLRGDLTHKEDIIAQMNLSARKQDDRIGELNATIARLEKMLDHFMNR